MSNSSRRSSGLRIAESEKGYARAVGLVAQADVARHVGPDEPDEVEQLFEEISEPLQSV